MALVHIKEFLGGLDVRRMPETTPGGVLIEAVDCHITAGGEAESRAAFVEAYTLPSGTIGLAATRSQLVTFGSAAAPTMPSGVAYQRLQHPDGTPTLIRTPSWDLYAGVVYAVGVFSDGSRHHFYNGTRVDDWFDGRARAVFSVVSGGTTPATSATASFRVTGGTSGSGNEITSITANGVALTSGVVAHTGNNVTTAAAVASAITSHTSSPDYTATSDGDTVTITASVAGTAANGRVLAVTPGGDVTVGSVTNFAGGTAAVTSSITNIQIDGVAVIASPVSYDTDNPTTATAIAAAITSDVSTPEYTAIAVGETVVITASTAGTEANGRAVVITTANSFVVTPASGLSMSGGAVTADTFTPGSFVETIGSKMNSLSGPNWHFSGIREPTKWTTDAVGAGFVDLSTYSSGSEELIAIAPYQDNVAIFSETNVQIWFADPDPALNTRTQILNNTGTSAANSVTQFGDSDIFYLNESGVRSLRARDSSNAASTSDIGVPIDDLVTEALAGVSVLDRDKIFGLIEPRDGRFWMIIGDKVFVLSYFRAERTVSAWTTYTLPGEIEAAVVFNRKVWLRVGNKVYVYGGTGADRTYDDTECVVRTPFLDADNPTQRKYLRGIDVAAEGEWEAYVSMDVNNPDVDELVGIFKDSTFLDGRIPANGSTSHFSFAFKSRGAGPHKLGSLIVHFMVDQSDKNES
jgi:hypothetical protein